MGQEHEGQCSLELDSRTLVSMSARTEDSNPHQSHAADAAQILQYVKSCKDFKLSGGENGRAFSKLSWFEPTLGRMGLLPTLHFLATCSKVLSPGRCKWRIRRRQSCSILG